MSEKYVCTLSPALQKQAKDELNENPATRDQDIETIRKWLKKQPHIKAKLDDWTILRFLRGCKFSLERTKEKLDMFYTCKTAVPEWFAYRDPKEPKMKELLEMGSTLILPDYDEKGRKVIIFRSGLHDPNTTCLNDVFKVSNIVGSITSEEEEQSTITGQVQIVDLANVKQGHAFQFTPAFVKKAMVVWQDAYPMRPKALHYINTPAGFDTVFNLFKSFMKDKMKKRVNMHGNDLSSLHKHVPPSILPKEYGGTNGTVDEITKYWLKKVEERDDWLKEDATYKVDESKRPGKPKTTGDLFGIEGSFRKLEID